MRKLFGKIRDRLFHHDTLLMLTALDEVKSELKSELEQIRRDVGQRTGVVRKSEILARMSLEEFKRVCRATAQSSYLGNQVILCRMLTQFIVFGDSNDGTIVPTLCLNGYWEPFISLVLLRLIQPGWHCIDVGANHGTHSLIMASAAGAEGKVLAIEPNPTLVNLLQRTIEANQFQARITLMEKAIADTDGETVKLAIPPGRGMLATIAYPEHFIDCYNHVEVLDVKTATIDAIVRDWEQVDLIKIDVEGAEESIWIGMQETIARNPNLAIVMEFDANRYTDAAAFLQRIQDKFALKFIDDDAEIKPLTVEQCLQGRDMRPWDLLLQQKS